MPLSPGTRVGAYEIVAPLGAGGMGEVYRARDARLGRDVAIKTLPDLFTADAERVARFEREAQILAALNHPNIGAIHGVEEIGASRFLVLELVDGEPLARRLERGRLPLDEALRLARQIVDALEAAHDKGIVHRDLKPANIMVTPDDRVKVLDFGLAKLDPAASPERDGALTHSPTLTLAATQAGVILGTAAYMSPEQAKGRPADKRSDVWAFGCVLYEMLSGTRPFAGEDVSDTLAAVLRSEPAWNHLPGDLPTHIRALLEKCLVKDRAARVPDLAVVRFLIDDQTPRPGKADGRARYGLVFWRTLCAVLVVALAGAVAAAWRATGRDRSPVLRYAISPPSGWTLVAAGRQAASAVISPDGQRIAFTARNATGQIQLFVRLVDSLTAQPVPGAESASFPFWSPDSRFVGYFTRGKVMKVAVVGGAPQLICEASGQPIVGRGGAWSSDDVVVFNNGPGILATVSAAGGRPSAIGALKPGETDRVFPTFLPDGKHALYYSVGSPEIRGLWSLNLLTGESRRITEAGSGAIYDPASRRLLLVRNGTLFAQSFDVQTLTLSGDPTAVAERVESNTVPGLIVFSRSDSGLLTYGIGGSMDSQLVWTDRSGKRLGTAGPDGRYEGIALSPDGSHVAAHQHEGDGGDIWVIDVERNTSSRLTFDAAHDNQSPVWSPDGTQIAFAASSGDQKFRIYRKLASGVGETQSVFEFQGGVRVTQWTPDGRSLIAQTLEIATRQDLWIVPLADSRKPSPWLRTPFNENHAQVSADGNWIAYSSTETGLSQIYVQPFPAATGKWQISNFYGNYPMWRRDGRELFFVDGQGAIFAVDVTPGGGTLKVGNPHELFDAGLPPNSGGSGNHPSLPYAVTADGQKFLLTRSMANATPSEIAVITNWTDTLKR